MSKREVIIKTRDIAVTYFMGKSNEVKALKKMSLEIYKGEFVIFFGPSGCGKSTLLYSIAGLERQATGEAIIQGKDVVKMTNKDLEKHYQKTIGMIFQAFYLIPSLSVLQNVMMPQIAIGVSPKKRKKKASDLLEYFGVGPQSSKLPTELSGGQQQRVAISRSLVNDPDMILADEPVGNLDSKSAADVLSLIQEMNRKQKKTVILVTHDPTHLDIADRVFYLKDGALIDVKENKNPRVIHRIGKKTKEDKELKKEKSNLELISKIYSKNTKKIDGMLLEYKAKEILLEVLTGMNSRQLLVLEEYTKQMIKTGVDGKSEMYEYLDKDFENGGADLDSRTAKEISKKVKDIVSEMRIVSDSDKIETSKPIETYVKQIRYYLLETFDVQVNSTESLDAIDYILKDRVQGVTDKKGVFKMLDLDLEHGGAGLNKRTAKKIAKRLELVLLGKYTRNKKREKELLKAQKEERKKHKKEKDTKEKKNKL
ncbi:MAG: ABC transporter ATP-binding protein [Candidatus Magasanikbacteria bacterium]|nr:ABC transporter ATP-binding protein [Candidatus Magasanikbacteria bacterium]